MPKLVYYDFRKCAKCFFAMVCFPSDKSLKNFFLVLYDSICNAQTPLNEFLVFLRINYTYYVVFIMPLEENSKISNIVRLRRQYCLHAIAVFQQSSHFMENPTPSDEGSFSLIKTTKKLLSYSIQVPTALNDLVT